MLVRWIAPALCLLCAACSGSSAPTGGGTSPQRPGASAGPDYTPGVFPAAAPLQNRCASPRSGRDIDGNSWPDRAGSAQYEKMWLRSWTEETYLWNREVVDRNPALYASPIAYFDVLRSFERLPSGREKDIAHYTLPTDEYEAERTGAPAAEYGVSFFVDSPAPPRSFIVSYTVPGSPADGLLRRGDLLLAVDGIDFINGGNTEAEFNRLLDGFYPQTAGEEHTFRVRGADGIDRTVSLTSALLSPRPVLATDVFEREGRRIGYLHLTTFGTFTAERDLRDAIADLSTRGIDDLILDLRYNSGGLLPIASQLSYMIAGPSSAGRVFERLRFNSDTPQGIDPIFGGPNEPFPFIDTGLGFSVGVTEDLPSLSLPRVAVLTTETTCSASEAVINGLRGIDVEVLQIGGTTCGKPYGSYPEDNCGTTYFTLQFQGVNAKGFGDYPEGFTPLNGPNRFAVELPGCPIADDLTRPLGTPEDRMVSAALGRLVTGECPLQPSAAAPPVPAAKAVPGTPSYPWPQRPSLRDPRLPNRP